MIGNKTKAWAARGVLVFVAAALVLLAGCASIPVSPNKNGTYTLYPGPKAYNENGNENDYFLLDKVVVRGKKMTVYLVSNPNATSKKWKKMPDHDWSFGGSSEMKYVTLINADNPKEQWEPDFTTFLVNANDLFTYKPRTNKELRLQYNDVTTSCLIIKSFVEGVTFDEIALVKP